MTNTTIKIYELHYPCPANKYFKTEEEMMRFIKDNGLQKNYSYSAKEYTADNIIAILGDEYDYETIKKKMNNNIEIVGNIEGMHIHYTDNTFTQSHYLEFPDGGLIHCQLGITGSNGTSFEAEWTINRSKYDGMPKYKPMLKDIQTKEKEKE